MLFQGISFEVQIIAVDLAAGGYSVDGIKVHHHISWGVKQGG